MSDLTWGLQMTALGMGTVFLLLGVLMGLLVLIGRLDRPPRPGSPAPADAAATTQVPSPSEGADDGDGSGSDPGAAASDDGQPASPAVRVLADGLTDDQLAAISVAVLTHREVRRRQAAPEQRAHAPGARLYASRWVGIGRGQQTQPWRRK